MYSKEIVEFCTLIKPIKLSVSKNSNELKFKSILMEETSFLNVYTIVPLSLRYYCIFNEVHTIPKCKCCNNLVKYKADYPAKGFSDYCGSECSRANKDSDKPYQKFLNDKEWLYEQRITLKKSKELIAQELGCSPVPITKKLVEFCIEVKKTNVKNKKEEIPDKETLIKLYKTKTLVDIGKIFNVSNVTISKWFDEYNIKKLNHSNTIKIKVLPKIIEKNIERYGVNHIFELEDIKEKIKNTFIKKYGVHYHPIGSTSKAETEILNFCNSLKDGFKKERIFGIEIDIFNEELKVGIEYCGLYWHQEKYRGRNQHKEKYTICKNNGIRLLTIFEDEWVNNKELTKKKISHILGHNYDMKIYARNCKVDYVGKDKIDFFNSYHIQGNGNSSINFGLYYSDALVAVMGFINHKNNKFELTRYATKYTIVGGFSKLLAHFKSNYNWDEIITFADLRWHDGESYYKNGFIEDKILVPDYSYVIGNKRIHKFNFRKKLIEKHFPNEYDPNESESQNMKRIGIPKIYDCGKIKFVLKK